MKFSVVIPTRRRHRQLADCLASLGAMDYPRTDFEVIVVDDGGGMPAEVIERARATITVRLVTQAHHGPATARNRGVAAATGTWIAFTDDDCTVDRGWLRAFEAALTENPEAFVGGGTIVAGGGSVYDVASQNIVDFLYEYFESAPAPTPLRFFATNNAACRRDVLLALGGFDESFPRAAAEDRDLCERWSESGRMLQYVDGARVTHHLGSSLARYWRQHLRYGQGANYLRTARTRRGHTAPRVEPLAFYARLVGYPLRQGVTARTLRLALLAFLSQAAYGIGYYAERALNRVVRRGRPATAPAPEPAVVPEPEPSGH